jgi:hypothetical protein
VAGASDSLPGKDAPAAFLESWRVKLATVLLWCLEFAVEPARRFGLQRVHVYLKLVDVTAPGASQGPMLEAGACLNNSINLRARLTHGTGRTACSPRR